MASKPAAAAAAPTAASDAAGAEGAVAPKSHKKLILISGVAVALIGMGAGGWFFWQHKQAEAAKAAAIPPPPPPLIYLALDPPFVANFEDGQAARFLQIDVRVSSREPEIIELIRNNEPLLRNDLLMLYGTQDAAELGTRAGKDRLRAESLATVRRIVKSLGGKPEAVEAVLFASFVMQ
ncbi:MAG: flagellar basal body-associated protein FliL [Gammaproteobacteria bacterium]